MCLSSKSIETLTDLIENKLASMEVFDREDARELAKMEKARRELVALTETAAANAKSGKKKAGKGAGGDVIAFPGEAQKRNKAAG